MNTLTITDYYTDILQFVKRRVQYTEDAKDLTQEIFYKLSVQQSISSSTWVYTVARNTIIDYYRKKKQTVVDLGQLPISENKSSPLPQWTEEQVCYIKQYLYQQIDTLPEDYKQVILLSEIQGMKQKDIAKELGLPASTVRSRVQRGRKKLKAKITACCEIIQGGQGSVMDFRPKSNQSIPSCNCSKH